MILQITDMEYRKYCGARSGYGPLVCIRIPDHQSIVRAHGFGIVEISRRPAFGAGKPSRCHNPEEAAPSTAAWGDATFLD